jgi:hypothetical protein
VLLTRSGRAGSLSYCGRNSIVIYLAFAVFMGPTRTLLLQLVPVSPDAVALLVTGAGVLGALALFWGVRDTRGALLVGASGGSQAPPAGRNGHWSGVAAQPSLGA